MDTFSCELDKGPGLSRKPFPPPLPHPLTLLSPPLPPSHLSHLPLPPLSARFRPLPFLGHLVLAQWCVLAGTWVLGSTCRPGFQSQ